ncbi:MAG: hypothetical protein HRU07_06325 [Nitrosopumilus sp.]|nr:hypothetical protein [Nitrosopumilus sp.]NRA05760.1 hypothetical protein [Nitrosopumilus sp.]
MPLSSQNKTFGNLQSYKFYIRPTAHRLFGNFSKIEKTKHQQNIQNLLQILMLNGTGTTWDMAKVMVLNDISKVRSREKNYRRLLIGRVDRGKSSEGILQLGLVVKDGKSFKRTPADQYRLSLQGILCCLDILKPTNNEIDTLSSKYAHILPKVFGKWDYLKSIIGKDVYNLKILTKGMLLDDQKSAEFSSFPFHELMLFLTMKYSKNFESISEQDLADQISFWFYTSLLYNSKQHLDKRKRTMGVKKLMKVFQDDEDLAKWYVLFFNETKSFYKEGLQVLNLTTIFPKNIQNWSKHII